MKSMAIFGALNESDGLANSLGEFRDISIQTANRVMICKCAGLNLKITKLEWICPSVVRRVGLVEFKYGH